MIQKLILFESFRVFNFCNFALPRSRQIFFQKKKRNVRGILILVELSPEEVDGPKVGNWPKTKVKMCTVIKVDSSSEVNGPSGRRPSELRTFY